MESLIQPNIHPVLVHFAYGLGVTSAVCYLLASMPAARRWRDTLRPAADWMLAFGAVAIIATIAAGFQAYYSVAHDGPSHAAMTTHRNWAVASGGAMLLLAMWRWRDRSNPASGLFKTLLTVAAVSLSVTAWWGGHIVYGYGLGVKSLPAVSGDGHDHDHGGEDGSGQKSPGDDHTGTDAVVGAAGGHDDSDGHHDSDTPAQEVPEAGQSAVPRGHDNTDGHHDTDKPVHDNSDGHHDAPQSGADDAAIMAIIDDIGRGWENGDGAPFRQHFLDFDGARYFESGGENTGRKDLVENHVEPEKVSIPDLQISVSNLQIHYEGDFAWVLGDSIITGTIVRTGAVLDRTGKQTWLLRKINGQWKIVHTHSSSRERR